jgi:hypothetical protein
LRGWSIITSKNIKEKMYREIKGQKWKKKEKKNQIKGTNRRKYTRK